MRNDFRLMQGREQDNGNGRMLSMPFELGKNMKPIVFGGVRLGCRGESVGVVASENDVEQHEVELLLVDHCQSRRRCFHFLNRMPDAFEPPPQHIPVQNGRRRQ